MLRRHIPLNGAAKKYLSFKGLFARVKDKVCGWSVRCSIEDKIGVMRETVCLLINGDIGVWGVETFLNNIGWINLELRWSTRSYNARTYKKSSMA